MADNVASAAERVVISLSSYGGTGLLNSKVNSTQDLKIEKDHSIVRPNLIIPQGCVCVCVCVCVCAGSGDRR